MIKKILRKLFFFLVKRFFFMTAIFKYEVKTQKQTIFRQSLFGNYHSTLNYLSNGIKYLYFFFSFKNFEKYFKVKWNNF